MTTIDPRFSAQVFQIQPDRRLFHASHFGLYGCWELTGKRFHDDFSRMKISGEVRIPAANQNLINHLDG